MFLHSEVPVKETWARSDGTSKLTHPHFAYAGITQSRSSRLPARPSLSSGRGIISDSDPLAEAGFGVGSVLEEAGFLVGFGVGFLVGLGVGFWVGFSVGFLVRCGVGFSVGSNFWTGVGFVTPAETDVPDAAITLS